mgnify:CR=1 FL=1
MNGFDSNLLDGKTRLHFVGIGGSGMFPLVQILHEVGYQITGSDVNEGDKAELLGDEAKQHFTQAPPRYTEASLVRALEADETQRRRKDAEVELHIQRLMPADALRIRGRHNAVNALAALALASAAGCSLGPMLYGLRDYRGEPHRVESVAIVHGVEYFDARKGTNVGATVAALPGLMIFITSISFNILSDGLRSAMDNKG